MVTEYCAVCPEETQGIPHDALRQRVYRLQKRIGISDRATTHQAQNKIHSQSIIDDWVRYINQMVECYEIKAENIANFDETNVSFDSASKRTLSWRGENTINMATATTSDRCTVMIGCSATGYKFPAFVIFKGKPGGLIARRELVTKVGYPIDSSIYDVQSNAWMDEPTLIRWVNTVWIPFATHPEQTRRGLCLLLWDEFKAHMVSLVVHLLLLNNTVVELVPAQNTLKCQVMDVGLNRPFETAMSNCYHDFVRDENMMQEAGTPIKPRQHHVAAWIRQAWYKDMKTSTILNTWKHIGINGQS